ncbi:MAG: hypothetical protein AMXMBFR53_09560 [Gemmatimonadota bacterium]
MDLDEYGVQKEERSGQSTREGAGNRGSDPYCHGHGEGRACGDGPEHRDVWPEPAADPRREKDRESRWVVSKYGERVRRRPGCNARVKGAVSGERLRGLDVGDRVSRGSRQEPAVVHGQYAESSDRRERKRQYQSDGT